VDMHPEISQNIKILTMNSAKIMDNLVYKHLNVVMFYHISIKID
jgi:hypothetical protein